MRATLFALMLTAAAPLAWAAEEKVKGDAAGAPNAEMEKNAQLEAALRFQEFSKKLEDAGFKDMQIVPQAILIQGKDKFDKPVVLVVDTLSMSAIQLQLPSEKETTGRGSSDDGKDR